MDIFRWFRVLKRKSELNYGAHTQQLMMMTMMKVGAKYGKNASTKIW